MGGGSRHGPGSCCHREVGRGQGQAFPWGWGWHRVPSTPQPSGAAVGGSYGGTPGQGSGVWGGQDDEDGSSIPCPTAGGMSPTRGPRAVV